MIKLFQKLLSLPKFGTQQINNSQNLQDSVELTNRTQQVQAVQTPPVGQNNAGSVAAGLTPGTDENTLLSINRTESASGDAAPAVAEDTADTNKATSIIFSIPESNPIYYCFR